MVVADVVGSRMKSCGIWRGMGKSSVQCKQAQGVVARVTPTLHMFRTQEFNGFDYTV